MTGRPFLLLPLSLCLTVSTIALGAACAPGRGAPVLGSAETPPDLTGTVSGIVRAQAANVPLSARLVTLVNVQSGAKFETSTAINGGYTIKVPVGRYRIEVDLQAGEFISESPGEIEITQSDLDAGRDILIGLKPAASSRIH